MADNVPAVADAAAQPFALAPALIGQDQPWDYSTRIGQNLYHSATEPLPYIFEGKTSSLAAFLQAIRARSDQFGWQDIFDITIGQDENGNDVFRDLLTRYGEISLQNVQDDAAGYIGQNVRNAQVSHQIFICLTRSISKEVADRMVTEGNKYMVDDTPDGPSYLMTLIQTFFVKTEAEPTQLRLYIAESYLHIAEKEYNVDSFNADLSSYVQKLHLTTDELMDVAKAKYDEMVQEGTWMANEEAEAKLVALQAQLEQVELKNKKYEAQRRKSRPDNKQKTKQNKSSASTNDKWKWKEQKPRPGQTTRLVNGKTYHWCVHHAKWCLHKSDECRLKPAVHNDLPDGQARQAVLDDGAFNDL